MRYPSVTDDEGAFIRGLGRNATPMTLFVDSAGHVVHTRYGQFHSVAEVNADVRRYLGIAL
jgi:hypothetical protein